VVPFRPPTGCSRPVARCRSRSACDNRTMSRQPTTTQASIGGRIAQGRDETGLTQADLADRVGLDRTAVAKIEAGSRKVSATELVAIADALDRPIDWFVAESPPAVLSRRTNPDVGGHSRALDLRVERVARDIAFLDEERILTGSARPEFAVPTDFDEAEALAREARALGGDVEGPIHDLQRWCESLGLLAFAFDLGPDGGDAAYVEVGQLGVALVNGAVDPGRRRFNLAHELGHHLVGDAYAPDAFVGAGGETERHLNAFAAHLLMPRGPVQQVWADVVDRGRRLAAIAVSVRFRVSWSATCSHLKNLGLVDAAEREQLTGQPPRTGDFLELGERWVPELDPPCLPPEYGRRVVGAYRAGKLTAARTVELLWGTVTEVDLPDVDEVPVDGLRREFEPLA
jgi:Zn-dependent peptidase ImmA (M78 family)/DNA-binding XRE family transcriptional regulator